MPERTYTTVEFPRTRLATFDIGAVGKGKHYVTALLEVNVEAARRKLRARLPTDARVSFTGWLVKVIADAVGRHKEVAAYRSGTRRLVVFDDVDVALLVEKVVDGYPVPLPLVIRAADTKPAAAVTAEIDAARAETLGGARAVLGRAASLAERIYYLLPGAVRRQVWRAMLGHPRFVFGKMGNVAVTSVGMMGQVAGWFVQTSVHPLSFGIGSITRKPVVAGDEIVVGEILHLTVLVDHDVVDGAPMARFIAELIGDLEAGAGL